MLIKAPIKEALYCHEHQRRAINYLLSERKTMSKNNPQFGQRKIVTQRELERRANLRFAALFNLLAASCMGCALVLDQPILAIAALIFWATAMVVAWDA